MKELVSILIPAYNAEQWIAETIKSALAQSWPRKEIIVVDDGSKDNTVAVARQFVSQSVSVVTQPNAGASAARNKAWSLCQGEYVQWLDADDLLSPDKVTHQMLAAQRCPSKRTLYSSGWGCFFYRQHKTRFVPTPLWYDLSPAEWLTRKMSQNLHMQTATWLVSRPLAEAAGPWDTRLSFDDDGEYFCRVIAASDGVRFIPGAKTFYRKSGSGRLSHIGQSNKKLESLFLSMRLHIGQLCALEDSHTVRAACLSYLRTWLPYFYPQRADILKELDELARRLGGQLGIPALPRKYVWIQKTLGWDAAKTAQITYNHVKESAMAAWDKAMFRLESRSNASGDSMRAT
jgi:glycosyltransferase involved in cell wall biosynthesis